MGSFCFCSQCGRTWSIEHACDDGLPGLPSLPEPPQEDAGMISTETQAHIEGQRRRAEATRAGAASALFLASKLNCEMKRCPKCKQAIEKVSGCNHMVCATCGVHFCWRCLEQISGYDHFNRIGSMRPLYNRWRQSSCKCSTGAGPRTRRIADPAKHARG